MRRLSFWIFMLVLIVVSGLEPAAFAQGTWSVKAPLPLAPSGGYGNFAMASLDGKVYVVGGQIGVTMLSVLLSYDPATDTWTTKSPMPTARGAAAAVVANGLLYVIGGCTDAGCGGFVGTVEAYDPITDTWTPKASMPTPRRSFGAGVIGSVIYAVGGLQGPGSFGIPSNEAYDTASDTWSTKASMPTPRGSVRAEALNGLLYAIGGSDGQPGGAEYALVTAYNPATDAWTAKASLPTPTSGGGSGIVNGSIFYVGGDFQAGALVSYDPTSDTWSTDVPPPTPCSAICDATSANGVLYVSGDTILGPFLAFTPLISPSQLLTNLTANISNLNLLSGVANSLDAKLAAVQASLAAAKNNDLNAACNQVGAFIDAVSAQSGKQITTTQASQLIGQANGIRSVLTCQ